MNSNIPIPNIKIIMTYEDDIDEADIGLDELIKIFNQYKKEISNKERNYYLDRLYRRIYKNGKLLT